jgi:hypothetical protein
VHPASLAVEVEIACGQMFGDAFGPAAPQQRAHARHQLADGEGLDDTVVGADRKPAHTFDFLPARDQHDDGQSSRRFPSAQSPADFQDGHAGQHPVEDDQVRGRLDQAQLRLVAPLHTFGAVALGLEVIGQQQRQIRLVLDDENARQCGGSAGADGVSPNIVHGASPTGASNSYSRLPLGRSDGSVDPVTR